MLVCPVGFVSDHLEIRWDIDHEAKERATELGMRLERIAMPNADPVFVEVLAGIVRRDKLVKEAIRQQTALLSRYPQSTAASDVGGVVKLLKSENRSVKSTG